MPPDHAGLVESKGDKKGSRLNHTGQRGSCFLVLVSVFEGLSGSRRFYCLLPWVYSNPTLRSLLFTLKRKREILISLKI